MITGKKFVLAQFLALTGTMFVWIPVLAPFFFSLVLLVTRGAIRHFDYLMPAELFPLALVGGILLNVAAYIAHSRRGIIGWGLGIAVLILVAGQLIAMISGLASGEIEPAGFWWALVLASLAIYTLALVVMGVGGVLLLRDLFKTKKTAQGA